MAQQLKAHDTLIIQNTFGNLSRHRRRRSSVAGFRQQKFFFFILKGGFRAAPRAALAARNGQPLGQPELPDTGSNMLPEKIPIKPWILLQNFILMRLEIDLNIISCISYAK